MKQESTDAEVIAWLRDCLDDYQTHTEPTAATAPTRRLRAGSPRSWVTAAAACLVAVGVVGVALVGRGTVNDVIPTATPPTSTPPDPADQRRLAPPGIGRTDGGTPTEASAATAAIIEDVLAQHAWEVALREHATRTIGAIELEWAYFVDGDRRLFVAIGPNDLLDTDPTLHDQLNPVPGGLEWPADPTTATIATITSTHTILVRSELIDTTGSVRPTTDLWPIANAIETELDDRAP